MARHVRDKRLEGFWREHVARQATSGLTVRHYCQRHDLKEPAFYHWRRTLAARQATDQPTPTASDTHSVAFLPVTIVDRSPTPPSMAAGSPIEIRLRHGRRIRVRVGCDRQLLAQVIAVLEAHPC
jgi:transposase-like protein